MMEVYKGLSTRKGYGDEFVIGKLLFNPTAEEISTLIDEVRNDFLHLTKLEQTVTINKVEIYEIDDDVDVTDEDELFNALCDCVGYNELYEITRQSIMATYGLKETFWQNW